MKERLLELYNSGLSVCRAAKELGMPVSTAYKWFEYEGIKPRGHHLKCEEYADRIIELVDEGMGYRQIAREIGIERNTIRSWLRKNNIKTKEQIQKLTQEEVAKRVAEHGFKYVGGYVNHRSYVIIYCEKCNTTFKRAAAGFQKSYQANIKCFNCMNIEAEKRKQIGKQCKFVINAIEQKKSERLKQKHKLIGQFTKQIKELHRCPTCDQLTIRKVYCSDRCQKRMHYRRKDLKRRLRISNRLIDKGITLEKLSKRDNGVCYLCGKPVDWNDYEYKYPNGIKTFYVGKNYPNVEHCKAIANNGEQSWKNVKLAHHYCNTLKGAKDV